MTTAPECQNANIEDEDIEVPDGWGLDAPDDAELAGVTYDDVLALEAVKKARELLTIVAGTEKITVAIAQDFVTKLGENGYGLAQLLDVEFGRRHNSQTPKLAVSFTRKEVWNFRNLLIAVTYRLMTDIPFDGDDIQKSPQGKIFLGCIDGLKALYDESQNPLYTWRAYRVCRVSKAPIPDWVLGYLDNSAVELTDLVEESPKKKFAEAIADAIGLGNRGRSSGSPASAVRKNERDKRIYLAVRDRVEAGVTVTEAIRQVSELRIPGAPAEDGIKVIYNELKNETLAK